MIRISAPLIVATLFAQTARAEVPQVVTDIAPVQALVAQVMAGVGVPEAIIPPNASPHDYAMRPSEARNMAGADLVVWVGPALTPWLAGPMEALSGDAVHLSLMGLPETKLLPFRDGAAFAGHDHAAEGDAHVEEGGETHAEEEHGAGFDPHVWLDPQNAAAWLPVIAQTLAELDPENAAIYRDNAQTAQADLAQLEEDITAQLAPFAQARFIVMHDAYHYFEARFGVEAVGAVSESDAATPGPARITELRAELAQAKAVCAFAEPQMNAALMATVTEGQQVNAGILDPMGTILTAGPSLYGGMLRGMADSMATCLSQ